MVRQWHILICIISLYVCFLLPNITHASTSERYSITVSNESPRLGDTITVKVEGEALSGLYGYDVYLNFDNNLLEYTGIVSGLPADDSQFSVPPREEDYNQGEILYGYSLSGSKQGYSGKATLAIATFKTKGIGNAIIELKDVKTVSSNKEVDSAQLGIKLNVGILQNNNDNSNNHYGSSNNNTTGETATTASLSLKVTTDTNTNTAFSYIELDSLEKAFQAAKENNSGKLRVNVDVQNAPGVQSYIIELPASAINSTLLQTELRINTSIATVIMPGNMFRENDLSAATIKLHITRTNVDELTAVLKDQIGNHPVINIHIQDGDKDIKWSNLDAPVTVIIPYTPSTQEALEPEHIVVWYIDDSGQAVSVPNGLYDPITGMVTFKTSHFSKYAINFVKITFPDIISLDWAQKQIEVLASKGIIQGVSNNQFNPAAQISRADFLVLLMRTMELQGSLGALFADIKPGEYYTEALQLARGLGITEGTGNNFFNPLSPITREDMMVLTDRALSIAKKVQEGKTTPVEPIFNDSSDISSYAQKSIDALVQLGLVSGYNHSIYPKESATRAQTAVLMYNIYKLVNGTVSAD